MNTIETELQKQSENNKMAITIYQSILTLNANGLNAPIKRQRVAEWKRKPDPYIRLPTKDSLQIKTHTQTQSKGIEKDISCKWKWEKKLD